MYKVRNEVQKLKSEHGHQWEDVCFRLPVVNVDDMTKESNREERRRKKRSPQDDDFFSAFDAWDSNDFEEG